MVKEAPQLAPAEWQAKIATSRGLAASTPIQQAMACYPPEHANLIAKGIALADILFDLGLDNEALLAALLLPAYQQNLINADDINEKFGLNCEKLLHDTKRLRAIDSIQQLKNNEGTQNEKIRKMLLSIVSDVRAVLIILAEQLWLLRSAKYFPHKDQQSLAQKTLDIYAPLANRLGIWQLKWEIEDLCLRYLQPNAYTEIARGLAVKRREREAFIVEMTSLLQEKLTAAQIKNIHIQGRVKHIYSIYNKMQRKHVDLQQIYDACALRVITQTIEDCYRVLSVIQNNWGQINAEFDDYISKPKPNGYQSIHTVIIGPQATLVEVQIRTEKMHNESELGVAAHWRYKEGVLETSGYESKIALLRQVMAWQKDVIDPNKNPHYDWSKVFADRVYVFTPNGDVIDLPNGATPLDFAYHIHSEVGHRCRGAKISGNIVPLTYQLKTGDRVEILTAKHASPSLDWLNPHAGYLHTSRARAKALHWFKLHDSDKKIQFGKELLEKELKRHKFVEKFDLEVIARKLNYKLGADLLLALANNDISLKQIINLITPTAVTTTNIPKPLPKKSAQQKNDIIGAEHLLTQAAKCCKPLPGDNIIGYLARNKGIIIHRSDCNNLRHALKQHPEKALALSWADAPSGSHSVDLAITFSSYSGEILQSITQLLSAMKISLLAFQLHTDKTNPSITLTIEVRALAQLDDVCVQLKKLPHITHIQRI